MDMKSKVRTVSEIEYENAEEAFLEYSQTGHTERKCLKCGGNFLFYDGGSGYKIWCENCDFKITARGI